MAVLEALNGCAEGSQWLCWRLSMAALKALNGCAEGSQWLR